MGNSDDWQDIYKELNDDYSILLIDLPGHGLSINLPDYCYTFENIRTQIISILNKLKIDVLNIIAYSMGGRLILDLLFNSELKINKIIFESVSFGIDDIIERNNRLIQDKLLCDKILNNSFEIFLKTWYDMPIWGNLNKSLNYDILINKRLLNNREELCKSLNNTSLGIQESYFDDVNNINNMLYISGEYDVKYNNMANNIIKINKNIKHINVNNAGHNVHFENKREYLKIIKQYLNEN
jgi:2-succinyl-6-hydroxy-2,4-cyclohexadiene-1-carboxylate synthase